MALATGSTAKPIGEGKTDYSLDGKPISLRKNPGRPKGSTKRRATNPLFATQEQKVEAASLYCVLGDFDKVASMVHVDVKLIKQWRQEPWWIELQKKIMMELDDNLLARINNTLDQTVAMLEDRIMNGDVVKAGETVDSNGDMVPVLKRIPIKARDLSQIFHALTHQRNLMSGSPTQITAQASTQDKLDYLQKQFREFANSKTIDGEVKVIEDK